MATRRLKLKLQDGYYTTRWTDERGQRHRRRFGKDKRKAELKFAEFRARWQVDPLVRTPADAPLTVRELWERFEVFAAGYYAGSRELLNIEHAMREVLALHGSRPAAEIGPRDLKSVQAAMVKAGLSRGVINARVGRVRRVFKWAASEELLPAGVWHAMQAVEALKRGRTAAPEGDGVGPVSAVVVEATAAVGTPTQAAMIRVHRNTGMRPGELVIMRGVDLNTSGKVWLYTPSAHKTQYLGKARVIGIGPAGQAALKTVLTSDLGAYVFDPRRVRREMGKGKPWQGKRRFADDPATDRKVRERYDTVTYRQMVQRLCAKAEGPGWTPNQLRHLWLTEARQNAELDAAQWQAGHSRRETTEGYAALLPDATMRYLERFG